MLILCVLLAHFLCCTGAWDVIVDKVTHTSPTTRDYSYIHTPLHEVDWKQLIQNLTTHGLNVSASGLNTSAGNVTHDRNETMSEGDGLISLGTLKDILMMDPMTLIGDVLEKINEPRVRNSQADESPDNNTQTALFPRQLVYSLITKMAQGEGQGEGGEQSGGATCTHEAPIPPKNSKYTIMHDVFIMHGGAALAFLATWLPSVYLRLNSRDGSTWTFAGCAVVYASLAWGVDVIVTTVMPKLGACMAMHQTVQFLYSVAYVCRASFNPPVAMPCLVAAFMQICIACVLFFITHACHGGLATYTGEEFYMGHVWGVLAAEALRATGTRMVIGVWMGEDLEEFDEKRD